MKKYIALSVVILVALTLTCGAGCSSSPPYVPPPSGNPQATVQLTNDCDFVLYVEIDNHDAGYLGLGETKQFKVTPGEHNIEFTGTDTDITYDDDFPLYFITHHAFSQNEVYPLVVRFGINF